MPSMIHVLNPQSGNFTIPLWEFAYGCSMGCLYIRKTRLRDECRWCQLMNIPCCAHGAMGKVLKQSRVAAPPVPHLRRLIWQRNTVPARAHATSPKRTKTRSATLVGEGRMACWTY